MLYINPDDSERILEDFVIRVSKNNNNVNNDSSSQIANESLVFLNDTISKRIILACLLIKHKEQLHKIDNGRFDVKSDLTSLLTTFAIECKDFIHPRLQNLISTDVATNINNLRLQFAVDQFVEAFYSFDVIEEKYPNLSKYIK